MKVGFQIYAGADWLGGQTTIVSTLSALRSLGSARPELALIQWSGMAPQANAAVLPLVDETITVPGAPSGAAVGKPRKRSVMQWLGSGRGGQPTVRPRPAAEIVRQHGVDCLFTAPREKRPALGLPLLLWLPDLQHIHLPEFFPPAERDKRDRLYRGELAAATLVIVTAEAVRSDVAGFAPGQAGKLRVLPFVVNVPEGVYSENPAELARRYYLPERFVWMPNQFWLHKNHFLVVEALHRLKARGVCPVVVCAGNPADHRDPQHFANLLRTVSLSNLREQFILLGVLPHAEVLGLMRQAVGLLNPSLFEGFGFSVAESKFVGKRALLSDLPVHREQDPPGAVYFDPNDANDLAEKLEHLWKTGQPGPDLEREAAARAAFPRQQATFARAFIKLAEEAVQRGPASD